MEEVREEKRVAGEETAAEIAARKAERRRSDYRLSLLHQELPGDTEERLMEAARKVPGKAPKRSKLVKHFKEGEVSSDKEGAGENKVERAEAEVVDEVPGPYDAEIAALADRTPEVRFSKERMVRPFNEKELKIIAAALRTRSALYRVADALHCSYNKIRKAIEDNPVLREMALERTMREQEEVEEAVDDCIKSRVPAVIMWKAEKIMPEKYGNQVNLDNEDDTKLVIGAIPEDEVSAAEAEVAAIAAAGAPEVELNAVAQVVTDELAAERAAGGSGVPLAPLAQVPPAPALNPPEGDPRFAPFVPAAAMGRVPQSDPGPDNFGMMSAEGYDDYGGGDDGWI